MPVNYEEKIDFDEIYFDFFDNMFRSQQKRFFAKIKHDDFKE